jgi:uncharacterized protein YfeS|tara:strand:- start:232 stop:582 length:351 start_codon:yes stop_codon:yes gene_type:complete
MSKEISKIIEDMKRSITITVAANLDYDVARLFKILIGLKEDVSKTEHLKSGIALGGIVAAMGAKSHDSDNKTMMAIRSMMINLINHWYGLNASVSIEQIKKDLDKIKANDEKLKQL